MRMLPWKRRWLLGLARLDAPVELAALTCAECGKQYAPGVMEDGRCAYCMIKRALALMQAAEIGYFEAGLYLDHYRKLVYGRREGEP